MNDDSTKIRKLKIIFIVIFSCLIIYIILKYLIFTSKQSDGLTDLTRTMLKNLEDYFKLNNIDYNRNELINIVKKFDDDLSQEEQNTQIETIKNTYLSTLNLDSVRDILYTNIQQTVPTTPTGQTIPTGQTTTPTTTPTTTTTTTCVDEDEKCLEMDLTLCVESIEARIRCQNTCRCASVRDNKFKNVIDMTETAPLRFDKYILFTEPTTSESTPDDDNNTDSFEIKLKCIQEDEFNFYRIDVLNIKEEEDESISEEKEEYKQINFLDFRNKKEKHINFVEEYKPDIIEHWLLPVSRNFTNTFNGVHTQNIVFVIDVSTNDNSIIENQLNLIIKFVEQNYYNINENYMKITLLKYTFNTDSPIESILLSNTDAQSIIDALKTIQTPTNYTAPFLTTDGLNVDYMIEEGILHSLTEINSLDDIDNQVIYPDGLQNHFSSNHIVLFINHICDAITIKPSSSYVIFEGDEKIIKHEQSQLMYDSNEDIKAIRNAEYNYRQVKDYLEKLHGTWQPMRWEENQPTANELTDICKKLGFEGVHPNKGLVPFQNGSKNQLWCIDNPQQIITLNEIDPSGITNLND